MVDLENDVSCKLHTIADSLEGLAEEYGMQPAYTQLNMSRKDLAALFVIFSDEIERVALLVDECGLSIKSK